MTDLKETKIRFTQQWVDALDSHRVSVSDSGSRAEYIIEAVRQRVEVEGGTLPAAKAPHGVRSDALPMGWLSRLYSDRYQLVVDMADDAVCNLHEYQGNINQGDIFGVLRADEVYPGDGRKVEVTIINADEAATKSDIQHDVRLAVMEFFTHEGN